MAEDKGRGMMKGSVTLQIHVSSAGLLGNVPALLCQISAKCSSKQRQGERDLDAMLKLTTQVWTYLANLNLATVQGEFEAAAVIESLSPRGSNQQR